MDSLLSAVERNPTKSKAPIKISMPGENDTLPVDESTLLEYGVQWARLNPPGPVSLWLWSTNVEYRGGSESLRRRILSDTIIALQARAQTGEGCRRGTKTKVCDALGMNVENASEENFELLEESVSALANVQWIRIHENEKKVTFIPKDLRTWTNDKPIFWVRERYRSAGEMETTTLAKVAFWIGNREDEKWQCEYPVAEGTFESLKQQWNAFDYGLPTTRSESGRILKDDYARALGKAQSLRHLGKKP
jgi:hypothetical protein